MRWWLSAVVWSLSTASVAVDTALLKPKVTSVASRSLSIVFGTPTTRTPFLKSACVIFIVPSPPTAMRTSMPILRMLRTMSPVTSAYVVLPFFTRG